MTKEEILHTVEKVEVLGGMTVNEHLWFSGLMNELTMQKFITNLKLPVLWRCYKLTNILLTKFCTNWIIKQKCLRITS